MRLAFSPTRWLLAGAVLAIFALSTPAINAAPLDPVSTEIERDDDLINDELMNDPDVPTNYNVDRIEDIDVPGPVPAVPLPPPPGFAREVRKDIC